MFNFSSPRQMDDFQAHVDAMDPLDICNVRVLRTSQ